MSIPDKQAYLSKLKIVINIQCLTWELKYIMHHPSLKIMCSPLSVDTIPLISPTFNLKAASSKAFCISPLSKNPRSPPFWQLEHSEYFKAISLKSLGEGLSLSWLRNAWMLALASSLDLVICLFLNESTGLLDSLCFWRICAQRTDIIQIL